MATSAFKARLKLAVDENSEQDRWVFVVEETHAAFRTSPYRVYRVSENSDVVDLIDEDNGLHPVRIDKLCWKSGHVGMPCKHCGQKLLVREDI